VSLCSLAIYDEFVWRAEDFVGVLLGFWVWIWVWFLRFLGLLGKPFFFGSMDLNPDPNPKTQKNQAQDPNPNPKKPSSKPKPKPKNIWVLKKCEKIYSLKYLNIKKMFLKPEIFGFWV